MFYLYIVRFRTVLFDLEHSVGRSPAICDRLGPVVRHSVLAMLGLLRMAPTGSAEISHCLALSSTHRMTMSSSSIIIASIISQYQELQEGSPWIGRSMNRTLDELTSANLFAIPPGLKTSVAQQLAHLRFWRDEAVERIKSGIATKVDADPDNWPDNSSLQKIGLEKNVSAHHQSVNRLIEALSEKSDSFLQENYYDSDFKQHFSFHKLITGILQHDVYHLAQIRMILGRIKNKC